MVIFHCYVSSPEGKLLSPKKSTQLDLFANSQVSKSFASGVAWKVDMQACKLIPADLRMF